MNRDDVLALFENIKPARLGPGYAPHKPFVVLLLLEMIFKGHENSFAYRDFDANLRRLLEKFGSDSAASSRNEPFWRLKNDHILEVTSPYSLLINAGSTPTTSQLMELDARARMNDDVYSSLRLSKDLIGQVAQLIASRFLDERIRTIAVAEAAPTIARAGRRFWWVSQNKTYREEVAGNFMWSPKTNANGGRSPYYDFMREITPGDIVFSFSGTRIRAIGVALQGAVPSPKPTEFGVRGNAWRDDGWLVEVAFYQLPFVIRPSEHMTQLAPLLPPRYSPIQSTGVGNQMYLAAVPQQMGIALMNLVGPLAYEITDGAYSSLAFESITPKSEEDIDTINQRTDIGPTEKQRLASARIGQGLFRVGVGLIETHCRITRTSNRIHLVASHIKPWSKSNDEERLSRYNGLLLSPHVDHLFDRGLISFEDTGKVLVSRSADTKVLDQWHIDKDMNVGAFRNEQKPFLEYHRDIVLVR